MINLTSVDLASLAPRPKRAAERAIWDGYVSALLQHGPALFAEHEINTPLRLCHLMATWAHESGDFSILWENMRYTTPERICKLFGVGKHSAKVTLAEARELCGDAESLAERVYGLGNPKKAREFRNTEPGDGFKFRGFGIQQVTGRADHERLIGGDYTALGAIKAALAEWTEKGCNAMADDDDVLAVRKAINGGTNGLIDVEAKLRIAKRVFTEDDFTADDIETVAEMPTPAIAAMGLVEQGEAVSTTIGALASQGSRVARMIQQVKAWFAALFVALGVTGTGSTGGGIQSFVADYWPFILCAVLLVGYLLATVVGKYLVTAAKSGRYVPRATAQPV